VAQLSTLGGFDTAITIDAKSKTKTTSQTDKTMKLKQIITIIGCMAGMFAPQLTSAQGRVTFLDNTGQTVAGNNGVGLGGAGSRIDVQFQTGTNAGGYTLNSISFLMANANNNTGAAQIGVLADEYGASLFLPFIASPGPTNAGLYTYLVPSVTLAANTDYWLMFNNKGIGPFQWSYASTTAAATVDGWSITGNTGPVGTTPVGIPMFAINATAVPEPSSVALLVIGTLVVLSWTRQRPAYRDNCSDDRPAA
jgi:hypothetical protein